ncbi:LuxR C-terminal-related transcriptional regulator [Streptomyces sp. NPDC001904]|uniref:LuxR C-terminal-related transcriptional regulator n=1 Tax=Streptomyces sp. NPDC001904 TaxID=3154531 RepID=UPI003332B125
MPAVLYDRQPRSGSAPGPTVTACLVWVAGTLVRVAGAVADPRSAVVLVDEAAAVLAAVPHEEPVRPRTPPVQPLTECQLAVLGRLQEEVSLRQIADLLYVSHNTVKSHVRAVYRKLGASSRAEAVRRGRELGLVGPSPASQERLTDGA